MENQKSTGFLSKLFKAKTNDCCAVQIEEANEDAPVMREETKEHENAKNGQEKKVLIASDKQSSGCC
ncbi:hypothetical protein [Parapedobacter tibetensis]|uniref:hypothetical protein n=1 Tax=Parapedobacter tibetensis TaxID=2972951 RepID=UPI00214DED8C|nr:hypothetical protein [Parapedobacter tibetensis]